MIRVGSKQDIEKQIIKYVGYGEESSVGILEDQKHVAKVFKEPRDFSERHNLLIGKDLNQDSYMFLEDLYHNGTFILGGISKYASGKKLDSNIIDIPFLNLLYATLILKRDTKIISDEQILIDDWKNFNTVYTDDSIKIVDTGRFIYSNKLAADIYKYNIEMIFSMIRAEYSDNFALKQILQQEKNLDIAFRNNDKFPEFFKDLEKYTSEKLGESVKSFGEYIEKTGKL